MSAYQPLPAHVDLAVLDREVIERWRADKVFPRSLEQTQGGPQWTFYEGPPTANGMPGTHHIEAYGIAEYNATCRESVQRHVDAFAELTVRMGYWVDFDGAYWTMNPDYIESVWWALKQIFDQGLLVEDFRVAPYCTRCGTGLSDHELAQGYETVVDPSVYVRLPVTGGPLANLGATLLVWTTTPWTLVSNTAVAVNPDVTYVAARTQDGEVLVVAEPLACLIACYLRRSPRVQLDDEVPTGGFECIAVSADHERNGHAQ